MAYDSWTIDQYPDGGTSLIFVIVWPAEAVIAGIWAAVDIWRGASWRWLAARWGLVSLAAALGQTTAAVRFGDAYTWADLPSILVSQFIVIAIGVGIGGFVGSILFTLVPITQDQSAPTPRTAT